MLQDLSQPLEQDSLVCFESLRLVPEALLQPSGRCSGPGVLGEGLAGVAPHCPGALEEAAHDRLAVIVKSRILHLLCTGIKRFP